MCISHYLNAGSKQYIDALERLKRKIQTKYSGIPSALELERIIDTYISEEQRKQRKGLEIIASVSDPTARDLLLYRYRDALPWETIAVKMMYSDKYIFVLHQKALEQFNTAEAIAV